MLDSEFWLQLEYTSLAGAIGATWLFPLFNSLHVLAFAFMLAALFWLDLGLMMGRWQQVPVKETMRSWLPWIWVSFSASVVTGGALFITRASAHVLNPAFQWKMLLMLAAGLNMLLLHFSLRKLASTDAPGTLAAWQAGLSLLLWSGVVLSGRWIGHIV
ncbi:hypothetical protein [Pseudohongiella nitratireducens]|uniref:hypothetical protein n=1 Tax=Pseudohongiella nitratireducens TaxID=1768907 RepID=UPI0030EF4D54|tara:strand:+ start:2287 stop:2763 length:477 start_codon:yes stop_codon:yes gene_type:complete